MINYYQKIDFDKTVFALGDTSIQEHRLRDLAVEWADETTTPLGVAPRMYTDGAELRTWGHGGNNDTIVCEFETEAEAEHALLLCHLHDLSTHADAPDWFYDLDDAWSAFAENFEQMIEVRTSQTHGGQTVVDSEFFEFDALVDAVEEETYEAAGGDQVTPQSLCDVLSTHATGDGWAKNVSASVITDEDIRKKFWLGGGE